MAFDAFLKIDGIEGGATDEKHPKWIEVLGYNHGVSQRYRWGSDGKETTGLADVQDFTITKYLDFSTPLLVLACLQHKPLKLKLELCRAAADREVYMTYEMTKAVISNVSTNASQSGDVPTETVTFSFQTIEWKYKLLDPEGKPQGNNEAMWDLSASRSG